MDDRVPSDQRVLAAGEEVRVFAERLPQEQDARVGFVDQDDRPTFLTPDEARDLARLLTHFAWVAEQDPRERNAFELGVDAGRAGFVRAGAEQ